MDSFKLLKEGKDLSEEEIFLSCALGWCIEWVCKDSTFFFNLSINYRYPPDSLSQSHSVLCSFKLISLCLMTLWITLSPAVGNLAGSEFVRLVWLLSTTGSYFAIKSTGFSKSTSGESLSMLTSLISLMR